MSERKFNYNLESFWENPDNLFTVRFRNLHENLKTTLAKRIKETAPQYSIKKPTGPTIQDIYNTLEEINPIIFGEAHRSSYRYNRNSYRNFNRTPTRTMTGWWYQNLCQAIYFIDCIKRPLTRDEIFKIIRLTEVTWEKIDDFLDNRIGIEQEETERIQPIQDIGIEDIERARANAERNGANRIPDNVFQRDEITENTQQIEIRPGNIIGRTELERIRNQTNRQNRPIALPRIIIIGQYNMLLDGMEANIPEFDPLHHLNPYEIAEIRTRNLERGQREWENLRPMPEVRQQRTNDFQYDEVVPENTPDFVQTFIQNFEQGTRIRQDRNASS